MDDSCCIAPSRRRRGRTTDICAVALEGDRTPLALVKTEFEERDAQFCMGREVNRHRHQFSAENRLSQYTEHPKPDFQVVRS